MLEIALVESNSLREQFCTNENAQILDKVGHLVTLPDTGWATKDQLINYFEVSTGTLDSTITRHKTELINDGYKSLSSKDFRDMHNAGLKSKARSIAIFPRRAILRLAMLLRDSEIAKEIRTYLLQKESAELVKYSHGSLTKMAEQLTQHSLQLAQHAKELKKHSQELTNNANGLADQAQHSINQSQIITAIINEVYKNRDHIDLVEKSANLRISNLEKRISCLEPKTKEPEFINKKQAKVLKQKVKKMGSSSKVWAKFKTHFNLTRYTHLPKHRFEDGKQWLDDYKTS